MITFTQCNPEMFPCYQSAGGVPSMLHISVANDNSSPNPSDLECSYMYSQTYQDFTAPCTDSSYPNEVFQDGNQLQEQIVYNQVKDSQQIVDRASLVLSTKQVARCNAHFLKNHHLKSKWLHTGGAQMLKNVPSTVRAEKDSENISRRRCWIDSPKGVSKRNRRTVFSTEQVLTLEKIFKKKQYISQQERQALTKILHISDRAIKIWFQNRRRLSRDNDLLTNYQSDSSVEENSQYLTLDYVESKVNEADEFGYVTLDDRAMSDLINVIDSLLSDEIDLDLREQNEQIPVDSSMYEPISPVSLQDNEENNSDISQWQPFEPEEVLRNLFWVQGSVNI